MSEQSPTVPNISELRVDERYKLLGVAIHSLRAAGYTDIPDRESIGLLFTTTVQHPQIDIGRQTIIAALATEGQTEV
jgi:hypothetical protein